MEYDDPQSLKRLSALLDIPDLGSEQDWDLLDADSHRVGEFCDVYEHELLTDPEKFALMELLVASYDRYLHDVTHPDANLESRIFRFLERDFELHQHTINYWSSLTSFATLRAVSPLMRRLLKQRQTNP